MVKGLCPKLGTGILFVSIMMLAASYQGFAAQKIKVGTAVKESPSLYLPILAAEDRGFWKENGLEAEWVPFRNTTVQIQSLVGGSISLILDTTAALVQAASQGVQVVNVAAVNYKANFTMWIKSESRFREPRDLRGAKVAISRMGSPSHLYTLVVLKAIGLSDKDVSFVGTGGIPESLSALMTGWADVVPLPAYTFLQQKLKGDLRQLLMIADYQPEDWVEVSLAGQKDFVKKNTDTVKRVVKAIIQGNRYIYENPRWTMDKMKSVSGYSEEAARLAFETVQFQKFSPDGRIKRSSLENVTNFLVDYGLVPKDKAPRLEDVYMPEFVGAS